MLMLGKGGVLQPGADGYEEGLLIDYIIFQREAPHWMSGIDRAFGHAIGVG